MYDQWQEDPSSVHDSWAKAFAQYAKDDVLAMAAPIAGEIVSGGTGALSDAELLDHFKVQLLIRAYRVRGHIASDTNPLSVKGSMEYSAHRKADPLLNLSDYGFTEADLNREFHVKGTDSYRTLFATDKPVKLSEIVDTMEKTYCSKVGYQYKFIQNDAESLWMQEKIESQNQKAFSADEKKAIMTELVKSDGFEQFLQKKYPAEKRFGLDGCEALIPGINCMIERAAELGATDAVLGMPHRGRLNVLCNVLGKPLEALFYEFSDHLAPDDEGQGDVKYHLGASKEVTYLNGSTVHLSLLANPSHLEAVNPVLLGKTRAKQDYLAEEQESDTVTCDDAVLPIILHGDAAFAGQGVVHECFGLAELHDYQCGGTIHVVVNNQVGFTTDPRFARSSMYCTDLGKMVSAPIVHVNSDSIEDVIRVFRMAAEYRQEFNKDFIIDLVCYRKFGHNEGDQPMFTQPRMYQIINSMTPVITQYGDKLISEGAITKEWLTATTTEYNAASEESFQKAAAGGDYSPPKTTWLDADWKGFRANVQNAKIEDTGVETSQLTQIGEVISSYPEDFAVHPTLKKTMKKRMDSIVNQEGIDWATAEALAFGTLLLEGNAVRLSGQDVERGTFNQRHHVLHDLKIDGKTYTALKNLSPDQGRYMVSNSHLSEYAVLGFELGYAQQNPNSLILWEAQFGDFANTAQCIIDQFIASGEEKWGRQAGLVMLLPHGQEGMGPEHSSCRIERYLQSCNDDESTFPPMEHTARTQIEDSNMQVCNITTPGNYFHALRRQVHREFRKPLIVASPKSLLRAPFATSSFADIAPGTRFLRFIPETNPDIFAQDGGDEENADVRRLVLCSGKVYYDIVRAREEKGITDIAVARIEQISPFPFDLVKRHAENFPNAEIVWAQEEPKNQGPWGYVRPRIETSLREIDSERGRPIYVGRKPSASTATGDKKLHVVEQNSVVEAALA
jgi:2-oxoglutarate dehydrogenase E1 component